MNKIIIETIASAVGFCIGWIMVNHKIEPMIIGIYAINYIILRFSIKKFLKI